MNRKMRVGWWFLVMGILCLGLTLGVNCKKKNQPPLSFSATFGGPQDDWGASIRQLSDGGYIIAGMTESYGAGSSDVWLVRTDASGSKLWDKTFGGTSWDDVRSVQQTSDGGYIIAGMTDSYGAGGFDVWLVKADSTGNKEWDKTYGGANGDGGTSVQQTPDGGYIIAGWTASSGAGAYDMCLIKTDASGEKAWDRTFGGTRDEGGNSVLQTPDGGYVIAGSTTSFGSGEDDVWLIKTDSSGSEVWDKTYGSTYGDGANSVVQTSDGGYIVTGWTGALSESGSDIWLVKTDSQGSKVWDKTFGGAGDDVGNSVQQTPDGGYIIAGVTQSHGAGKEDVWLIKTDSTGSGVWDKTFGGRGNDGGRSVQLTSDGGYVITGSTASFGAGGVDVWLIKTDADGN